MYHILRLRSFKSFCPKKAYAIIKYYKHQTPLKLHKASAPELSGTLPSTCTRTLRNLTGYVHRNPPEPHQVLVPLSGTLPSICTRYLKSHQVSAPKPSRTSPGICTWNPPEPQQVSAPEPSRTSPGICTGTPEPQQVSAPKSSRTSLGICTRTLWSLNLTTYLRRNLPKPHQVPAPELSGTLTNPPEPHRLSARNHPELHQPEPSGRTSPGICTGTLRNLTRTLRNLTRYLHREPSRTAAPEPREPSGTLPGTWC